MSKDFSPRLLLSVFIFFFVAFGIGVVLAWTSPTVAPPGGNVAAPQVRVSGVCASGAAIRVVNADGTVTCQSAGGGGGGASFWASSGANIYNTNTGNVGIGTTAPAHKLDVQGGRIRAKGGLDFGDDPTYIQKDVADTIGFYTNFVNRLTINPGGNVGIGTVNPGDLLTAAGIVRIDRNYGANNVGSFLRLFRQGTEKARIGLDASDQLALMAGAADSPALSIRSNGNVGIGTTNPTLKLQVGNPGDGTSAVANLWGTFSSLRYKENIIQIKDALSKTLNLRGVYFDWKNSGQRDIGLIAEEVAEIVPEVVEYSLDGKPESIDYGRLTSILIEAIKFQQMEIEQLKVQVIELQNR